MHGERFYVRILGRKCTDKHTVTLYIRVKRDNEPGKILYSTGIKCPRKQFSATRQSIIDETINTIVQGERLRVLRAIFTLKESCQTIALWQVEQAIKQSTQSSATIGDLAREVIAEHAKNVTPRTLASAKSSLFTLLRRLQWDAVPAVSITSGELETRIIEVKPYYSNRSFLVNINYLRWVFAKAKRKRIIVDDPFDALDIKQITKSKRTATPPKPDLNHIKEGFATGKNPIERYDDMAFFQLMSGMAFVDVVTVTSDMIIERDGSFFIVKERQKSKVPFIVPIDAETKAVFIKHGGFEGVDYSKYRYYLNSRYALNSHVLRHARASDLLNKGLSLEAVAGMLGHTNISMTLKYAPLRGRKLSDDEVERVIGKSG